jgi:SAM-dependent methyltransferase
VSFTVDPDPYDRFMGRYSRLLAPQLADLAAVSAGQRVLDVGCGPGALTAELVKRLGATAVSAVDPSEPFVAAVEERHPGVDVRRAAAERLPFQDAEFDATLAQLVVHLMDNPTVGVDEMVRVTRKRGVVAASVWDYSGGRGPVSVLWDGARELDPEVVDESHLAGVREGHLAELFEAAGLQEVEETAHSIRVEHSSFEEWWEPFTLGVASAGSYVAGLDPARQAQLRERCREKLPTAPFLLTAHAWAARGLA